MKLKTLFNNRDEFQGKKYHEEEKIEKFIFGVLSRALSSFYEQEYDASEHFKVEVLDNEFSLVLEFGHIDLSELLKINEAFKEHGFELSCVTDTATRNKSQKGLVFLFNEIDQEE